MPHYKLSGMQMTKKENLPAAFGEGCRKPDVLWALQCGGSDYFLLGAQIVW